MHCQYWHNRCNTYILTNILWERLFLLMHLAPAHHPFTCGWGISERLQQRQRPRHISSKKYSTAKTLSTTEKNQDASDTWSHYGTCWTRPGTSKYTIEGETRNTQESTWWSHPWPPLPSQARTNSWQHPKWQLPSPVAAVCQGTGPESDCLNSCPLKRPSNSNSTAIKMEFASCAHELMHPRNEC